MADIDFQPIAQQANTDDLDFQPIKQQSISSESGIDFQPIEANQPSGSSGQLDFQPSTPQAPPKSPPSFVSDEDIAQIATKHGVSADYLKDIAPYYDVPMGPKTLGEAVTTGAKAGIGEIAYTRGFGIPQFLYKKLQDPSTRAAIDEMKEMGESRKSGIDKGLSFARQIATPVSSLPGAGTALGRIAGATGIGAVAGIAGSREGEELKGAEQGAVMGAGFGAGTEGLSRLFLGKMHLNPVEQNLVKSPHNQDINIGAGAEEIAGKTRESEDVLQNLVLGDKETLSPQEIDSLVRQQLTPDGLAEYLNPSSEEGALIRKQAGSTDEGMIKKKLADDIVEDRIQSFAEDLTREKPKNGEDALANIQEVASRQGDQYVAERYKQFVDTENASRYLNEAGARVTSQYGFYGRALNFISDSQYVLRDIDNRVGTSLEPILREANKDYNRSTYALKEFRTKLQSVYDSNRVLGVDDSIAEGTRLYDAMKTGDLAMLDPKEQRAAQHIRQFFDDFHDFQTGLVQVNDPRIAPLATPKRENYIPEYAKPIQEVVPLVESKIDEVTQKLSQEFGRPLQDLGELSSSEFKQAVADGSLDELVKFGEWLNGKKITNGAELSNRLKQALYSREGNVSLEIKAKSSLEREGGIPDFILEKNIYKLMSMNTANTIRAMYLRRSIDALRNQAGILEKAGAEVDAQYVRNLIMDIQGVRKGTAAEASRNIKTNYYRTIDSLIDRAGGPETRVGSYLVGAKAVPDVVREMLLQIYPNMIGWNLRAAFQNATGAITKLAPELGSGYGYSTLIRASLRGAANFSQHLEQVRKSGYIPAGFVREGEAAIAEGLQRSSLYKLPRQAIDGLSKASMALHQGFENFNRVLSYNVGQVMAEDLVKGVGQAQDALAKFPRTIQLEIQNNPEQAGAILGKYLNDTTSYNYNRLAMSEFGRTMGPFFSTFSKWPTATAGDMIATFRDKGILSGSARNFEKYVAPFLLLQAASVALGQKDKSGDGLSDRQKLLMGSHGLTQAAPLGTVTAFGKGEVGIPPAVAMTYQSVVRPLLQGKNPDARKLGAEMANTFIPGAGLLRFITQDMVTLSTGHKVEGSDFFEKTDNGLRRLNK